MSLQTGYGIQDFYKTATSRGIARDNLFRIKNIDGVFDGSNDDLLIFAKAGTIPSRNINTAKVNFKSFEFVVPMSVFYPENTNWSLTFLCDSQYVLRDVLETWSRKTFDEHNQLNVKSLVDIEAVLINNSYSDITKDSKLKEIRSYKFIGCFPSNVGPISYNAESTGAFVSSNVNIAFQYYITDNNPING